tara:strand:- start:382 stop:1011 length:630 start_codon:yes stop_codon:yes gene_type:complete
MNYTELVAASIAYADRQDIEVSENMDTFILLAEARINRVLKTREQSVRATVQTVTDQEFFALPPDYAGMRDIHLNYTSDSGESKQAQYNLLNPEQLTGRAQGWPNENANYYQIIANQFKITPAIDTGSSIEITYYQKVPNLNAVAADNWLSISHPDIYLCGMTSEIELFAKNYDAAQGWQSRMSTAIGELDNTDVVERWSGAPMQTRVG